VDGELHRVASLKQLTRRTLAPSGAPVVGAAVAPVPTARSNSFAWGSTIRLTRRNRGFDALARVRR
jgi:hypothetical protein